MKMSVIDAISSVYDKVTFNKSTGSWEMKEDSPDSGFNSLTLMEDNLDFIDVPKSLYKNLPSITTKNSNKLKDLDCDGAVFALRENDPLLILGELKSNLKDVDAVHAYEQLIFTLLKLHTLFSLCKDYDINQYRLIGIIGFKPPKDKKQETFLKDKWMLMQDKSSKLDPKMNFLVKLYFERNISICLKNIFFIRGLPLPNSLANKKINLCLQMPKSYTDTSLEIELSSL